MKDIVKGIIIGLIVAIVPSGIGYVWVVKENKILVEQLKSQVKDSHNSVNALKLFVVSAHPDKNYTTLASMSKLQTLKPKEIYILASDLPEIEKMGFSVPANNNSYNEFLEITDKHKINEKDLKEYSNLLDLGSFKGKGVIHTGEN